MADPKHLLACSPGRTLIRLAATYTKSSVRVGIGAPRLLEDCGNHVIEVMVRVRIVVAFGEPVDEDAWIGRSWLDLRIGAITMFKR